MEDKKKYKTDNLFMSWESEDRTETENSRAKRMVERANFMIKFWQEELKYCKEFLHIRTKTYAFGNKTKSPKLTKK